MFEIPGSVENTVDLDASGTDEIEDQVGSHHEDAVTHGSQTRMTGDTSQVGMTAEVSDALVEGIGECYCPGWTVVRDELENRQEVFLCSRQISDRKANAH